MFNAKQGLKDKFSKQEYLLGSLRGYTKDELQEEIYNKLGISDMPKQDFINIVKEKTKSIFQ